MKIIDKLFIIDSCKMNLRHLFATIVVLILGNSFLCRSVELDLINIKEIKDVLFFLEINGVTYRRGYSNIKDRAKKDFNLDKVEKKLDSDKIPLNGEFFKKMYSSGVSQLKKSNIRIKEIYDGQLSIVPVLTVSMELQTAGNDLYVLLVQLLVSERVWIHPGKENKSNVYIWYKKKIDTVQFIDLKTVIQKTVTGIITEFIDDFKNSKLKK